MSRIPKTDLCTQVYLAHGIPERPNPVVFHGPRAFERHRAACPHCNSHRVPKVNSAKVRTPQSDCIISSVPASCSPIPATPVTSRLHGNAKLLASSRLWGALNTLLLHEYFLRPQRHPSKGKLRESVLLMRSIRYYSISASKGSRGATLGW